jgi:radical SAM superfamily enzyme YgiQ (UPF0313 family)
LGLAYLAGAIKTETNWHVMVYNSDFHPNNERKRVSYLASQGFDNYLENIKCLSGPVWNEIRKTILEYKPSIIGITSVSPNFQSACMVAKLAKAINNEIIVIIGGPHPTIAGSDVLNCPDIDLAVKGEGEITIVELLKTIKAQGNLNGIKGIVYRIDAKVVENPAREFIKNLDSLSFPHENAREQLKDYDKYPLSTFGHIFAIRGCPYNCFFCGSRALWSRNPRFRSPQNVVREIKSLQEKGLRRIYFDDDTFATNKEYLIDLCKALIKDCPGLKWACEIHVKLVDKKTISLMKAAGCYLIQIGIESGNNEILKIMRKEITIQEALLACEIINKEGISLEAFFMIGFPQETEDTLKESIAAMKRINGGVVYSIFTPYPYSEAFKFCKEYGLIGNDYDISLLNHQSPENCFCINITPTRFRLLASKIEKMIDRKNSKVNINRIFSLNTIKAIQEQGVRDCFITGIKLIVGK